LAIPGLERSAHPRSAAIRRRGSLAAVRKTLRPWEMREGCAPGGPGRRRARRSVGIAGRRARRWPGAVGNGGIVAYRARSPARSAAEGHARPLAVMPNLPYI